MYNLTLQENEEIKLISDNTTIYNKILEPIKYSQTSIITTNRFLILDYPSLINNPKEELRIIGKLNYIKQKEIIFEIELKNIISIEPKRNYYQINISKDKYIIIDDQEIIKYLKQEIKNTN